MSVLIFAVEAGRFGPARLPEAFARAGLTSVALCPADNLLARSGFLRAMAVLDADRSARAIGRSLDEAIIRFRPKLIIPADEQAVVLLHAFAGGPQARHISDEARVAVLRSLGAAHGWGPSLYKTETMAMARRIGVPVPAGGQVYDDVDAVHLAQEVGLPVYVKQSFSWAGLGVIQCHDADQVASAYRKAARPASMLRQVARVMLGRDWYPIQTAIDIQASIRGEIAMFCALAWHGRLIGGFAAHKLELAYPNGPSKTVRLCDNPGMRSSAERMIEQLGFHGLLSFDFVLPEGGEPLLIECNPRPVPVAHLGDSVGVDLPALLAGLVRGGDRPERPLVAEGQAEHVLFPHSLNPANLTGTIKADVPEHDPGLIAALRAA